MRGRDFREVRTRLTEVKYKMVKNEGSRKEEGAGDGEKIRRKKTMKKNSQRRSGRRRKR